MEFGKTTFFILLSKYRVKKSKKTLYKVWDISEIDVILYQYNSS